MTIALLVKLKANSPLGSAMQDMMCGFLEVLYSSSLNVVVCVGFGTCGKRVEGMMYPQRETLNRPARRRGSLFRVDAGTMV